MSGSVIDSARVFIDGEHIEALCAPGQFGPAGYGTAPTLDLPGCDLLPGLMDLHNHLPYNVLPLWTVPMAYQNRNAWIGSAAYRRDVSQPMDALRRKGAVLRKALVRYVEVKLLLAGTTTVQGNGGSTHAGSPYRGLVRNLELPDGPGIPVAGARVPDLRNDADRAELQALLDTHRPCYFHLAEGLDAKATAQFEALKQHGLVRRNLVCIHCLALDAQGHKQLAAASSRVVWSPLSNLLLYGQTLDPRQLHPPFAIGSDWSPSGSKNLLLELKVAWLLGQEMQLGATLGFEALARAVTVDAAGVAQCDGALGSLAVGRLADLLVLRRRHADPFENLVRATERDVQLVFIAGWPRYGAKVWMQAWGAASQALEALDLHGQPMSLLLDQPGSPLQGLGLQQAMQSLEVALQGLGAPPVSPSAALEGALGIGEDSFDIELDLQAPQGPDVAADTLETAPLKSVPLDALTVVSDSGLLDRIAANVNAPPWLQGDALRRMYK